MKNGFGLFDFIMALAYGLIEKNNYGEWLFMKKKAILQIAYF